MQAPTADAGAKDALEMKYKKQEETLKLYEGSLKNRTSEFNKLKGEKDALAAEYEELKAVREVCGVCGV